MRSFLVRTASAMAFFGGVLSSGPSAAYPHRGERMGMTQPDGSRVEVVLWGDEFYVRAETPNGYTLTHNSNTHFIVYAVATGDGNLASSGVVYDGIASDAQLASWGITPGARLSKARRDALVAERRLQRAPSTGSIEAIQYAQRGYQLEVTSLAILPADTGTPTGLVVLVDFPDRHSTIPITEVETAFNSTAAYGATWHGSIRNWSEQISEGITSVQHKVVGFYTAKYEVAHYNAPTAEWDYSTADELYKEVYAYIDANVDLTSYAISGALPSLALVYAGDIVARGWAMALWPHGGCGGNRYRTSEGVTISQCLMTNLGTSTPLDLETFRHELGHSFFHWPDTYDYDDDSQGAGGFATETDMPCAPFRMWAGWINPYDVTSAPGVYSLAANGSSFLRYNNAGNANEYFVAEYAKKSARRAPPDEGLLVWHIDEKGDNSWQDMTAARHYMTSVEQADGKFDLEHNVRPGAGDLFHAGYKDRFDGATTPNSNWWNGSGSGFVLCDIGDITSDTMTVNAGCVSSGGAPGTGGTSGVAGSKATGGIASTGGRASTGGIPSTGGRTNTGGRSSTGGVASLGGKANAGGTASTGGVASAGGKPNTGGQLSTGGITSMGGRSDTSIVASTGGSSSTGGNTSSTNTLGGTSASSSGKTGSSTSIGGSSSAGGSPSTVGGNATGGAHKTGGTQNTDSSAKAGTSSVVATTDNAQSSTPEDTGSCSCRTVGHPHASWASLLLLSALGLASRRRRRA